MGPQTQPREKNRYTKCEGATCKGKESRERGERCWEGCSLGDSSDGVTWSQYLKGEGGADGWGQKKLLKWESAQCILETARKLGGLEQSKHGKGEPRGARG